MVHKEVVGFYVLLASLGLIYGIKNKLALNSAEEKLQETERTLHNVLAKNDFLKARQSSTRSLRHDLKHHFDVLLALLRKGDVLSSKKYLQALGTIKPCLQQDINSGNSIVDSVLAASLAKASASIKISFDLLLPPSLPFAAPDLTILFGNLVDNAVEATGFNYTDFINISAKIERRNLIIEVANSFYPEHTGHTRISLKPEAALPRGQGFKNMQKTVDRYGGILSVQAANNVFRVLALLPFPEKE